MKVWLVTNNPDYEEFNIDGIFSTQEEAIAYVESITGPRQRVLHGYHIEEYMIDNQDFVGVRLWWERQRQSVVRGEKIIKADGDVVLLGIE